MGDTINIVTGKVATASSYVKPYSASRAIDQRITPVNRWLSNQLPCCMSVNLQGSYLINRWVVTQMGAAGWKPQECYNLSNYKLQGSLDNANWFDLDVVTVNKANSTDRTFRPVKVSYVRLYVSGGINCNNKYASVNELAIYTYNTSQFLSGLVLSSGTLSPAFTSSTYLYSANVDSSVSSITVTPTAIDAYALILVNDVAVASGSPSVSIPLNSGNNTIRIQVTTVDNKTQLYSVNVARGVVVSPYLSSLTANLTDGTNVALTPSPFVKTTLAYTGTVDYTVSTITLTPYSEDMNATVVYNNNTIPHGQTSQPIALNQGNNPISITVFSSDNTTKQTYTVSIIKAGSSYLKSVTGIPGVTFDKNVYTYSSLANNVRLKVNAAPDDDKAKVSITLNASTIIPYNGKPFFVDLMSGENTLIITVTDVCNVYNHTYTFKIIL